MGFLHWVDLPAGLSVLAHPLVLAASGFMCFVEFFADKIPGVDSAWDVVQTFIRIPARAVLAASVFGDASTATMLAAAIVGGTLAAGSHVAKAGSRALDQHVAGAVLELGGVVRRGAAVGTMLWLAFAYPVVVLVVLAVLVALMVWLIPRVWRLVRRLGSRLAGVVRWDARAADAVMRIAVCLPEEDASPWMRAPGVRVAGRPRSTAREPDAPARAGSRSRGLRRHDPSLPRGAGSEQPPAKGSCSRPARGWPTCSRMPNLVPTVPVVRVEDAGMAAQMARYVLAAARAGVQVTATCTAPQQRQAAWTQVPATRSRVVRGRGAGTGVIGTAVARALAGAGLRGARARTRMPDARRRRSATPGDDELPRSSPGSTFS